MNKLTKSLITIFIFILPVVFGAITVGDTKDWNQLELSNRFYLGKLYQNQNITVRFQYEGNLASPSTGANLAKKGLNPSGSEITCSLLTCVYTFTAAQETQYELLFSGQSAAVLFGRLRVTGNSINRTNPQLLKVTGISKSVIRYRIRLTSTQNYQITLKNYDSAQKTYYAGSLIFLSLSSETNNYGVGDLITRSSLNSTDNYTITNYNNLAAGYYWITLTALQADNSAGGPWKSTISYSTQPYTCPYDPNYPDVKNSFNGCTFPLQASGFPCLDYDNVNIRCGLCTAGYTLTNGVCFQNTCPTGQYKKYGLCYPNPVGCQIFSEFIKCTKCASTYTLKNGLCERIPLICGGKTYYNSQTYQCAPADSKCNTFNTQNGACTSCISQEQAVVNGKCVSTICGQRQFIRNGVCVDVESSCLIFQKIGGNCLGCAFGFVLSSDKKCIKIICPDRFVPNDNGNCIRVSDLCLQYNERGACQRCIPTHIPTVTGECLQIYKPTICLARQYLGSDNKCYEASPLCDIYSNGICVKCIDGYFVFAGACVQKIQCNSRQYIFNNNCVDVSSTCGQFDKQTGKCLTCANSDYEFYYGVCILKKRCGDRQWIDPNGNCINIDPSCKSFNPSTGTCTDCQSGFNFFNGICCSTGQYRVDGKCVPIPGSNQSINLNNDGCRIRYDAFGCIQCFKYFKLNQDNSGYGYCTPL